MTFNKNSRNSAESPVKDDRAEKRLIDSAVREYVEKRFEKDGKAFLEEFSNGAPLSEDFKKFLKTREGYKSLSTQDKFSNSLFTGDIRKVAYHLENLQKTVRTAIFLEYDLGNQANASGIVPMQAFENLIGKLKLEELSQLAKSAKERAEFVRMTTKEKPGKYRKGWTTYLNTLQNETGFNDSERTLLENHLKNVRNFEDVETAKLAFRSGSVSQDEIRTILGFIRTPEAKRAIVKAFLPQVSLGDLVWMKINTRVEAENALYETLLKNGSSSGTAANFIVKEARSWDTDNGTPAEVRQKMEAKLRDVVSEFDLNLAYVDTSGLADSDLDTLLEKSELPKILEEKVTEGMEELRNILDPEKDLEADDHGRVGVSFAKKIVEEFSGNDNAEKDITGVELFLASATGSVGEPIVFEGIVEADGSSEGSKKIRVRINEWMEYSNGERKLRVGFLDENGGEARQDTLTYEEFYRFAHRLENRSFQNERTVVHAILVEDSETKRQLQEANQITDVEERERKLNEIRPPKIDSVSQLEEMFDDLDPNGKTFGIKSGVSVTVGKPGNKDYNVVTIESVTEGTGGNEGQITILNTNAEGSRHQTMGLSRFYLVSRILGASRSKGINTAENVLSALGDSLMKANFEDIGIEGEDTVKFVPKSKRGQSDYEGVKVFYKKGGKAFEVGTMEQGRLQIRMLESFDPGDQSKGKSPKGTSSTGFAWFGYETLYKLIRENDVVPYEGLVKEIRVKEPEYASEGRMKKFLNNPSFFDFIHGMQEIPKFVKKKLEHSSHHHAAHMTLAIAGKIPLFPEDWLTDLQMEIHNEDKSTLGKEVDRLNSFSSPKRHEQALRYLKDKGAHDYEIIAAALSLLEKHGSLYPGILAKHEKDWFFFSRMPGSAEAKKKFLQEKRFGPDGKEREVKEPEIIMLWLQKLSGPDEHHPISPYYWLEVKKRWKIGSGGEFEMGQKESEGKETMIERADYAISKFKGKEYAHGIGAMEKIWDKPNGIGGTISWRMRVPFVLAMSNVRKNIHSDLAQKFTPMFDAGHVYPPLLFIQHAEKQDVFRKVIKRLSMEAGGDMAAEYAKVERLTHEEEVSVGKNGKDEELIIALDAFWGKYGNKLSKKLLVTVEDPDIILRKGEVSEFGEYLKILGSEYGDSKFDGNEINSGTYEVGNANWSLAAPSTFVKQFKVQAGHGGLNSELEQYLFGTFKQSLEKIRSTKYGSSEAENLEIKKKLFQEYHLNFQQYIHTRLGSDKLAEDPKAKGVPKFANEPYMRQLTSEFGFTPKLQNDAIFEGDPYKKWLNEDFNRFMSIKSVKQYGNSVSTNVDGIIDRNLIPQVPTALPRSNPGRNPIPNVPTGGDQFETEAPTTLPENVQPSGADSSNDENGTDSSVSRVAEENPEETLTFRERFAPVVDRMVDRFGKRVTVYAEGRSLQIREILRKAQILVPEDLLDSEWALEKMVERYLELEPANFFQNVREDDFVGNEFLRDDVIETRIGMEALASVRRGRAPNIDHVTSSGAQIYLHMLFLESEMWKPEDFQEVGKILMNAA